MILNFLLRIRLFENIPPKPLAVEEFKVGDGFFAHNYYFGL